MATSLIPRIIYYGYNLLKGGKLQAYYHDVKIANSRIKPISEAELSKFLLERGFDPVLEKNPVMNKELVKMAATEVLLKDVHSWAYTGGSYGEPLRVPYSVKRSLRRTATFKFFNEIGGYSLGDPFVLIRAKSRPAFVKYFRNEHIFIPHDLSHSSLASFCGLIRRKKIKILMGYPSVIYELALYFMQHPEAFRGVKIKSIISVSEPLEALKKETIRKVFKCRYIDRYSNEEVGLIAQQKDYNSEYFVNKYGIITEVVDPETLMPVAAGVIGKVLVTDIYNDLVPMVRYDTGDIAVAHSYMNGRLQAISGISGRSAELIASVSGHAISSLTLGPCIYKPLSNAGLTCQYQFAQTGQSVYELRIKALEGQISVVLLESMKKELITLLGPGALIQVLLLKDIPALPSGKRPVFKNEYLISKRNETVV